MLHLYVGYFMLQGSFFPWTVLQSYLLWSVSCSPTPYTDIVGQQMCCCLFKDLPCITTLLVNALQETAAQYHSQFILRINGVTAVGQPPHKNDEERRNSPASIKRMLFIGFHRNVSTSSHRWAGLLYTT